MLPCLENSIRCGICHKQFSSRHLTRHMKVHKDSYIEYQCKVCKKSFFSKKHFTDHMPSCSNDRLQYSIHCRICSKKLCSEFSFKRHFQMHKNIDVEYHCQDCKKTFFCEKSFTEHMAKCSVKEINHPFCCEICNKVLSSTNSFNRHLQRHKDSRTNCECEACGKNFFCKRSFTEHLASCSTHKIDQSFCCEICNRILSSAKSLKRHLQRHNDSKENLPCEACGKIFFCKRTYTEHLSMCSINKMNQSFSCEICGKMLFAVSSLKRHVLRTHKDSKMDSQCKACGKRIFSIKNFIEHLSECSIYQTRNPIRCVICNRTLSSPSSLKRHLKMHEDGSMECLISKANFTSAKSVTKRSSKYLNGECDEHGKKCPRGRKESHSGVKGVMDRPNNTRLSKNSNGERNDSGKKYHRSHQLLKRRRESHSKVEGVMDTVENVQEDALEFEVDYDPNNISRFGSDPEPCVICREKFCNKMSCINALEYAHTMVMKYGQI